MKFQIPIFLNVTRVFTFFSFFQFLENYKQKTKSRHSHRNANHTTDPNPFKPSRCLTSHKPGAAQCFQVVFVMQTTEMFRKDRKPAGDFYPTYFGFEMNKKCNIEILCIHTYIVFFQDLYLKGLKIKVFISFSEALARGI